MARVSMYLNFMGTAEEAFGFYGEVFGTAITALQRFGEVPGMEVSDAERNLVMHAELPILAGAVLMGTDMLESQGHHVAVGTNITINLEPDSLAEGQRIFTALAEGGSDLAPLQEMFWGSWWGCVLDRYGIRWMVNAPTPPAGA